MGPVTYIGLDIGLSSPCAVAFIRGDRAEVREIKPKTRTKDENVRIGEIIDGITEFICATCVNGDGVVAAYEQPFGKLNMRTFGALSRIAGGFIAACRIRGIKQVEAINIQKIKMTFEGHGSADKEMMVRAAMLRYPTMGFDPDKANKQQHMADALGVAFTLREMEEGLGCSA